MGKNSKSKRDVKLKKRKKAQAQKPKPNASLIVKQVIEEKRSSYIASWSVTAKHYEEQGYYKWMAQQISGYKKVLEVGSGDGRATRQLLDNGHQVISIDENPKCLDATEQYLIESGYKVKRLDREILEYADDCYDIKYSPLSKNLDDDFDVLLINADISHDPHLYELLQEAQLDAVICWLIGSHGARPFNKNVIENGNPMVPAHYRILTQNRVYEVADKILEAGKVLHIVDRGGELTDDQREAMIQCHEDQASVTELLVQPESILSLNYSDPISDKAMEMQFMNQATGEIIKNDTNIFCSITAIKQ